MSGLVNKLCQVKKKRVSFQFLNLSVYCLIFLGVLLLRLILLQLGSKINHENALRIKVHWKMNHHIYISLVGGGGK